MSNIEFHPLATDEMTAAYNYVLTHINRETAVDFRRRLDRKLDCCQENPLAYQIRRDNVRCAHLERFREHYLAYMVWSGRFAVIALGHAKRRPYYWHQRPRDFRKPAAN